MKYLLFVYFNRNAKNKKLAVYNHYNHSKYIVIGNLKSWENNFDQNLCDFVCSFSPSKLYGALKNDQYGWSFWKMFKMVGVEKHIS